MRAVFLKVSVLVVVVSFLLSPFGNFVAVAATGTPAVPGNLILNPQMLSATVSSSTPDNWFTGGYGTSTVVYSYPVPGPSTGDIAAQVSISNYTSGAAEWYFKNVPVVGKNLYQFSDSYNSNIDSYIIAQWTMSDGSFAYDALATLPATSGVWENAPQEIFPAPANAVSVTILHLIQNGNGTLSTTNYALTNYTPTGQGAFSKAMVSLTFDNGWVSQFNNGRPILNAAHIPATYYIITNSTLDSTEASSGNLFGISGISTSTVVSSSTVNFGDITNLATSSAIYTDPTYQQYTFTDTYTSTATSTVNVKYCSVSVVGDCPAGNVISLAIGTLPSGNNLTANFSFTLPVLSGNTVTPISISQSLAQSGSLTVSNPSLIEYQEFMNEFQLQTLQAEGNEIDSHTETHPDLNLATTSIASTTEEINGSRSALLSFGMSPVDGFAYPFGSYNASVVQLVGAAGYKNARTVDVGFNSPGSNPLLLKSESVTASTTLDTVQSWIDSAIANKFWLVITFHDVDPANIIAQNNETYGVTPTNLQSIVSYLQTEQQNNAINVVTMDQGLAVLNNSTLPPVIIPSVTILPGTLQNGTVGTSYSQSLSASTTAVGTFTWNVSSGSLPAGLTFATSSAIISGTPTTIGTSTFSIFVTNGSASTTQTYTINIIASTTATTTSSGGGNSGGGESVSPQTLSFSRSGGHSGGRVATSTFGLLTAGTSITPFIFTRTLYYPMRHGDVIQLQKRLMAEGFFNGPITGYFGNLTRAAVKAYQKAKNINPIGVVGPVTRAMLNKSVNE